MARGGLIELEAGRVALLPEPRDEHLRQHNPLARLGPARAATDVGERVLDALHVRHRLLELVHRRARGVHVRIDQARHHHSAAEIDLLGAGRGEREHVGIRAGGENPAVADRHRFHDLELRIDGRDLAVMEDVARRRLALEGGDGRKRDQEKNEAAVDAESIGHRESSLRTRSSALLLVSRVSRSLPSIEPAFRSAV